MDDLLIIRENFEKSIKLKKQVLSDVELAVKVKNLVDLIIKCYKHEGKVLFCGNGGSAADAQHLAAELSGRYYYDRPPLFAEALHVNTSYLTAVANDYSYDQVYSRLIKGIGKKHDVLIGFSTSGTSSNIINAFKEAKKIDMKVVGFCGQNSKAMQALCDIVISIPSKDTPRVQECFMLIGHAVCEIIERRLFPRNA